MATLAFAALGAAAGGAIGGTVLGLSAAAIGQAVGAYVGSQIDAMLMPGLPNVNREGPRLESLDVMTAQAGEPLADISGRVALAGTVIWASKIRETANTDSERVGSGKRKQTISTTTFSYSCSFAVALGEGTLAHWGRVWADGRLIDLSDMVNEGRVRFYPGTEWQGPDHLISATEGTAPAFRGVAYLVFQDFDLTDYGNRVPQVKVEVWGASGDMEPLLRGVNIIPGTTESGYATRVINRQDYAASGVPIATIPQNAVRHKGVTDWSLSMDLLSGVLPNCDTASLVVAWFGDDLRAGQCEIKPRVEVRDNPMDVPWSAGGLDRNTAPLVTQVNGKPAYGSSPSDASVVEAIRDLKARGKRVVLYPFIMMDLQASEGKPNPQGGGTQPDYPWRGRIKPTAGASVATEMATFVNREWGLRRFIRHLAQLAAQAGGVDAILVGTELRGVSMAHAGGGSFPFVDLLKSIAADVRAILPTTKISYAADWSEYHSVRENGEVWFHLDPLWSDENIDFVGIDNYLPLSDWRDGPAHLDRDDAAGRTSIYDLDYLKSNVEGGEYWDWFYADDAARAAQIRSPINDTAHGENWVFRQKAIRDWHASAHHNRPGGVRAATRTGWVPGSKPFWFTELGCPAVDKGANQPNVFVSRLSSESSTPHFSGGVRDDFIQRQYLRAMVEWWRDNGGGVLSTADIQVWAWDSRPFPEFPMMTSRWSDGPDWFLGHWLNGRAGAAPAAEAMRRRAARHDLAGPVMNLARAFGQADGYAAPGPLGFREYVAPFEVALGLQAHEAGGALIYEQRAAMPVVPTVALDDMSEDGAAAPFTVTRSALEDVAAATVFRFRNGSDNYNVAAARAVIGAGSEDGESLAQSPLVLDFDRGTAAAERLLRAARDGREVITLRLPRSAARHVRPGVVLPVLIDGAPRAFAIDRVTDGRDLVAEGRSFSAGAWSPTGGVFGPSRSGRLLGSSAVLVQFLDLPVLPGVAASEWDGFVAAHASPWPGAVTVARSPDPAGGFTLAQALPSPAVMGETIAPLAPGLPATWGASLDLRLFAGALTSRSRLDALEGRNLLAVRHAGGWELVRFETATLLPSGARHYRLSGLVRGERGTDPLSGVALPQGASVVVLDGAVQPAGLAAGDVGRALNWRTGPADTDPATHAVAGHTFSGVGLRPFAPAHLRADPVAGDVALSWVRRSRAPVETFADRLTDPPLAEASEAYRVEIGPAGAPVRAFTVNTGSAVYTAAQRTSDGITAPFRVAVAQLSETYGPGFSAEIIVET